MSRRLGYLCVAAASALWGFNGVFSRIAMDGGVEPLELGAGRAFAAALLLLPFLVPYARRVAFEVMARDALGREARARTFTWADGLTDADRIGYQVLPDRFRGDGGAALATPSPLAARAALR